MNKEFVKQPGFARNATVDPDGGEDSEGREEVHIRVKKEPLLGAVDSAAEGKRFDGQLTEV